MKMLRFLILLFLFESLNALKCRCKPENCPKVPDSCPAGITLDNCRCCTVCAKAEGEECGGLWDSEGKCGNGLKCFKPENVNQAEKSFSIGVCLKY